MLPAVNRMRASDHFRKVTRAGYRCGDELIVVHMMPASEPEAGDFEADHHAVVGFVVPKKVGHAVVRNRVKRRLRAIVRAQLAEITAAATQLSGLSLVIRALPAAANADYAQLEKSLQRNIWRAHKRMQRHVLATSPAETTIAATDNTDGVS